MSIEGQFIEYKDFHKDPNPNEKAIISKLFKEITAFANSSGGEVIVGKEDKTGIEHEQQEDVYKWLENDRLTTSINRLSDNLVVFTSQRKGKLIVIKVSESDDVICAISNAKDINKGDCFERENHESVLVKGNKLRKLIERKALSEEVKTKALRKIVHYKMNNDLNHANKMNIFDSMFVSLKSPESYINMVFHALVKNEFVGSYKLPISKYSTMQMHIDTLALKTEHAPELVQKNNRVFATMMESEHSREAYFSACKDEVLCSPQLKYYISEFKGLIDGL